MAQRFGRNQKRRMREEIAAHKAQVAAAQADVRQLEGRLRGAERQQAEAEARAFSRFLADAGRYEYMCNRLVDMAARELGEKLRPQVESIMSAARSRERLLYASVTVDAWREEPIQIIRIEVPRITVNYADSILGRY